MELREWGGSQAVAMGSWKASARLSQMLHPVVKSHGPESGSHAYASFGSSDLEPSGERGSVSYHEAEVDIQVLIQEPGHHLSLNVPHKKTMMLARLKQKARSNRWSRRAVVSDVPSSSCWVISTVCHISPSEEATKCSSKYS